MMRYVPGDRVRVSANHHWAQGAAGTIAEPPESAQDLAEDSGPWDGWHRFVKGVNGPIEFYFVWFDEPQRDADGDGPYKGGEIEAEALDFL
jgi:hypothetical protein